MKSKLRKLSVPLVAALVLAATVVVLAAPGATAAASGETFLQAGYTLWTDGTNQLTGCSACYVRIVDNNTGAVYLLKTGDSLASYHWAVWLTVGHEYHFYVQYEGHFCAALSRPFAPYNIDWPPNSTNWINGGLLEPADGGVGIAARELDYVGTPTSPCPE